MVTNRREKEKRKMRYASAKERAEKHEKAFDPTQLKVPADAKLFRFKKKKLYKLDFLPYQVGKGNPYADEDFMHYERTYFAHFVPTPEGGRYHCCLAKTFKEDCPICEEIFQMRKDGKDTDGLQAKERQLFNVIDLDEKEAGVQIFEFNWWQLGKLIDAKIEKRPKFENFFHLVGGATMEIDIEEGTYEGKTTFKPISIDFEPRDDYDDEILEKVHCLDDLLKKPKYDELRDLFLQKPSKKDDTDEDEDDQDTDSDDSDDDSDDDDETPVKSKKGKKPKDDDPTADDLDLHVGDLVQYEGEECEITKISPDGTSLTLEDEDGNISKGVAPSEVSRSEDTDDSDDSDDDDDKPPVKSKKKGNKPDIEDDDPLEDDLDTDDDEEDEPPVKKKKRK